MVKIKPLTRKDRSDRKAIIDEFGTCGVWLSDAKSGKKIRVRCKSSRCPICVTSYCASINEAIKILALGKQIQFITYTYDKKPDLKRVNEDWNRSKDRLKRKFNFDYVKFIERGSKGTKRLHLHLIIIDLARNFIGTKEVSREVMILRRKGYKQSEAHKKAIKKFAGKLDIELYTGMRSGKIWDSQEAKKNNQALGYLLGYCSKAGYREGNVSTSRSISSARKKLKNEWLRTNGILKSDENWVYESSVNTTQIKMGRLTRRYAHDEALSTTSYIGSMSDGKRRIKAIGEEFKERARAYECGNRKRRNS